MVDVVEPKIRSRMMSGIRGKDTKPEMLVRKALSAAGYRYRLHRRDLPGAPDVVMSGRRVAIFVHGCFWHVHSGCKNAKLPSTRPDFWRDKLEGNVARDRRAIESLRADGWRVLIIWECATRDAVTLATLPEALSRWIADGVPTGEISGTKPA